MLVVPAIDLAGGRAVRLVEGDPGRQRAYAETPAEVMALAWRLADAGARRLHVVDLDAALGSSDNGHLVGRLIAETPLAVQVAGGIRSDEAVTRWLEAGAAAVVMGTTAVRQPETEDRTLGGLLEVWEASPLAGVILTSVDRDGTLRGPDIGLLSAVLGMTRQPVTYSGGIASLADIQALAAAGAAGVILGKSLLEGLVPLSEALSLSLAP
jgi:phosphoribosylformimino-5-aminoimidazole carboxamide ribonucleotide (ProFAR) isomerase